MASPPASPEPPTRGRLGSLSLIWRTTTRYPLQLVIALVALTTTSLAT